MELHEALARVSEVRQKLARSATFRGYRAAPAAFSGFLAIAAAIVQHIWLIDPAGQLTRYPSIWVRVAIVSLAVTASEMAVRHLRRDSAMGREMLRMAAGQFCPCLLAGALVTVVVVRFAPTQAWMLPGLWSILYGLGIFASRPLLPPAIFFMAGFYLLAGLMCLALAQGEHAFSPWAMGASFGPGQLIGAMVLY